MNSINLHPSLPQLCQVAMAVASSGCRQGSVTTMTDASPSDALSQARGCVELAQPAVLSIKLARSPQLELTPPFIADTVGRREGQKVEDNACNELA